MAKHYATELNDIREEWPEATVKQLRDLALDYRNLSWEIDEYADEKEDAGDD